MEPEAMMGTPSWESPNSFGGAPFQVPNLEVLPCCVGKELDARNPDQGILLVEISSLKIRVKTRRKGGKTLEFSAKLGVFSETSGHQDLTKKNLVIQMTLIPKPEAEF